MNENKYPKLQSLLTPPKFNSSIRKFKSKIDTSAQIFLPSLIFGQGLPDGTSGKEHACQCRRHKRCKFDPWVGKISWRRAWQSTPVVLPGESNRQRSPVDYSPQDSKESDTTEATTRMLASLVILLFLLINLSKRSKVEQKRSLSHHLTYIKNTKTCLAAFCFPKSQEGVVAAAAAAKSLQLCPTLCNPRDGSPPGSLSLGFPRQEHWSGLPFPSPMHESEK